MSETVTHIESPTSSSNTSPSYVSQILCSSLTSDETTTKPLLNDDLDRVLDFEHMTVPLPNDSRLRILMGDTFVTCECLLRGGYFFYKVGNEEENTVGIPCIPLYQCIAELPPGGRRVFRDHIQLEGLHGTKGYEFVIYAKQDGTPEQTLGYIVSDKLSTRGEWLQAIEHRSNITRNTGLKMAPQNDGGFAFDMELGSSHLRHEDIAYFSNNSRSKRVVATQTVMNNSQPNQEYLTTAVKAFGHNFNEVKWVFDFFREHDEFDSEGTVERLESYLREVRCGLRFMILDEYENFVDASKELTIMGKEILRIRNLWNQHLDDSIFNMKGIKFREAFNSLLDNENLNDDGSFSDDSNANRNKDFSTFFSQDNDDFSSASSDDSLEDTSRKSPSKIKKKQFSFEKDADENDTTQDQLPSHLSETIETYKNLSSLQCQYTEASKIGLKVKAEVENLLSQDEKLTENKLTNKQISMLHVMEQNIEDISSKMCRQLVENLRRKNEALRQTLKRDRASIPLSELLLLPLVSPTCLNDDINILNILVKHGQSQQAAKAYAARRTLLLNECLNERPLSGSGIMDLVINAAQLSQNFFASLSTSVEGFLDLFLDPPLDGKDDDNSFAEQNQANSNDNTHEEKELNTIITSEIMNKIPAGALASIVFWCDVELHKFANYFCGPKLLGSLALSSSSLVTSREGPKDSLMKQGSPLKDHQVAIEVASKCIDQVFRLASNNLDSIGLPLSPKLAVYIRTRLKGCEAEIAHLLGNKWNHIIYPWFDSQPSFPPEEENQASPIDNGSNGDISTPVSA